MNRVTAGFRREIPPSGYSVLLGVLSHHTWLKRELVDYLHAKDALDMNLVSRQTRFLVSSSSPAEWKLDEYSPRYDYKAYEWFTIPIKTSTFHTVIVTGRWKDQGYGNKKGMLAIVANSGQALDDDQKPSTDVVSFAEPAPHKWEEFQLSVPVRCGCGRSDEEAEEYKVWYKIGGGGGHSLHVKGLYIRLLEYADGDQT